MKNSQHIIETWIDNPKRILVGGAVIGIGGYVLYKFGKNILANIQKNAAQSKVGESLEVQQATVLRTAMNPSGVSWMMSFDGTNADTILTTASQIKSFTSVVTAYKQLYQGDLVSDLQSELTTSDYSKFLAIVSGNSEAKGSATVNYAKEYQPIVALKEVTIRSSPDASYHGAWYESSSGNNILVVAKAGAFIGYATGKQQYDAKNDVKFIQVGYQFVKTGMPAAIQSYAGKTYSYWVSSSSLYVAKFNTTAELLKSYPNLKNDVTYKKPLGTLSGIAEMFSRPVITKKLTTILDSAMKPTMKVAARTLLGDYIMSLDTGTQLLLKFKTVDNTERWVNAQDVHVQP